MVDFDYKWIGALLAITMLGSTGYYIMTNSYDICTSSGVRGPWVDTGNPYEYYCAVEDSTKKCWDILDYGDSVDAKCMLFEKVGEAETFREGDAIGIIDSKLSILHDPEYITCLPDNSQGILQSKCEFKLQITDFLEESACLELPLIWFENDITKEKIDVIFDFGITEGYTYDDKICNIKHKRDVTGYFYVPLNSKGKYNVYAPFMGINYIIDPYYFTLETQEFDCSLNPYPFCVYNVLNNNTYACGRELVNASTCISNQWVVLDGGN